MSVELAATVAVPATIDREAAERRLAVVGLALILLVGAALRLWGINSVGLNSDEAVYSGQAAALAGDPTLQQFFAIFRAHPLLVQFLLAVVYLFGINDIAGRLIAVAFGVAAIWLTYALGRLLFNRRVGLVAAAVLAVMPYHVAVSRQILLDGPESTLWLLAMYLLARYAAAGSARWLYVAAFAAGLTTLAKETGVLVVATGVVFALMTPTVRVALVRVVVAAVVFVVALSPYPAAILLGGASGTARQFLLWEIFRRPNHTGTFYFEVLAGAVGPVLLALAILGVIAALRIGSWQDRLLLSWVFVPLAFFELWPVKGYQYLLPLAPAFGILAGRVLEAPWSSWLAGTFRRFGITGELRGGARALAIILVPILLLASLAPPTLAAVSTTTAQGSLAGTGGLPGGREAGTWIRANIPVGSTFLTIGPTMANIVEFYGLRRAYGLSVSPNPLRRNPAYDPIINPDRAIQTLQIQFVALDVWSAARSPFFDGQVRRYVEKYHGQLVYAQTATTRELDGTVHDQVVIQIYKLRP